MVRCLFMRDEGLTLVEVLVVIAIIAILLTITVPVLQKSKQQGETVICTNNLRQLGIATLLYAQEKKFYPEGFCGNPTCHPSIPFAEYIKLGTSASNDWQNSRWWFHFLLLNDIIEDDFSRGGLLCCPSKRLSGTGLSGNLLCGNYGINYSICKIIMSSTDEFSGKPLQPEHVGSPSTKLLLMDSGYALVSWKALATDSTIYPFERPGRQNSYYLPGATINEQRFEDGTINEFQQDDAINGRHSAGKFNAVFADGHVGRKKPSSVEPVFDATGNILSNSPWSP